VGATASSLLVQNDNENRQTLTLAVLRKLRSDILQGHLAPGARLGIEALRDTYGVAGSTLREALTRLIADGLVVGQEQRGFRVATVSRADLDDLVRARQLTDCAALRDSMLHKQDSWEAGVVAAHFRLSRVTMAAEHDAAAIDEEWEQRHRAFHAALVAGCQSQRVIDQSQLLYDQADRYRRLAHALGMIRRDPSEHASLLAAVVERDADRACRELAEHYALTKTIILAALDRRDQSALKAGK